MIMPKVPSITGSGQVLSTYTAFTHSPHSPRAFFRTLSREEEEGLGPG